MNASHLQQGKQYRLRTGQVVRLVRFVESARYRQVHVDPPVARRDALKPNASRYFAYLRLSPFAQLVMEEVG